MLAILYFDSDMGLMLELPRMLHQLIQKDYVFKFMKHVAAYFQQTFYNVLGMIRPTWFLTLSAADMKWPDVIQCIAYQYGETFTEEQVKI